VKVKQSEETRMRTVHIILALSSALLVVEAQNYCDRSLCNGNSHIACGNSGVRIETKEALKTFNLTFCHFPAFLQFLPQRSTPDEAESGAEANDSQHA
jgi:hypothetical protein